MHIDRQLPVNFKKEDHLLVKGHNTYDTNDAYIMEYHNVLLSPDSVIYKGRELQRETLASPTYAKYYGFRHFIKKYFFAKRKNLSQGHYLLVTDNWSAGHFHWLCDVLPKLWCIRDKTREFVLLLPDTSYIRNIALPSLEMLGLQFSDIQFMNDKEFYRVNNLHFVSKISRSGTVDDNIMRAINNKFNQKGADSMSRIYISREKARIRKVLNEAELIALLKEYDFQVLNPEEFSFKEQLLLFNSCEALVSIHGSGLTNALFMSSNSKMVEFRRDGIPDNHCYWHLAGALGIPYYYYLGIPDSDQLLEGNGCNLTIPVEDFRNKILNQLFK